MSIFKHHSRADNHGTIQTDGKPLPAPEINPTEGVSALLLLAGLLAVICGSRRLPGGKIR